MLQDTKQEGLVQLGEIVSAQKRISPYLSPTPLYEATSLSGHVGTPVFAKLECMNPTGAFKVRGAFNCLLSLRAEQKLVGVVTASGGSHGLGVAYAANRLGIQATVFVGQDTSAAKIAKIKRFTDQLHIAGERYHDAYRAAVAYAEQIGQPYIHGYADPAVIAGQGTIGLEIVDQLPTVCSVIVPVGGGGLICGMASAIKTLRPEVQIVAVQPEACPALSRSLAEGKWYETYDFKPTIADGLAGGIGRGALALAKAGWIDTIIDVPESAIHRALAWIFREEQWMIEGAAAISVAAVLEGKIRWNGPLCCVLSGANIALDRLVDVLTCC